MRILRRCATVCRSQWLQIVAHIRGGSHGAARWSSPAADAALADRGCQVLHHLTRGLDRTFLKLAGCDWIREHGPSGRKPAVLGREYAALAIAIVSTKAPGYFLRGAGGYFAGMVRKAEKGELHLERTLWALRQAKWGEPPPLPCANA